MEEDKENAEAAEEIAKRKAKDEEELKLVQKLFPSFRESVRDRVKGFVLLLLSFSSSCSFSCGLTTTTRSKSALRTDSEDKKNEKLAIQDGDLDKLLTDQTCKRFLLARESDIPASTAMFVKYLVSCPLGPLQRGGLHLNGESPICSNG